MRPLALDLFCGAGGMGMGLHRAGFDVIGVDKEPRPNYPFAFIQADALGVLRHLVAHRECCGGINQYTGVRPIALISTGPPCQEKSTLTTGTNRSRGWGSEHPQLVPPTRELLDEIGLPYVIEQPQGHGGLIRADLKLCADMFYPPGFPPPWVQRHREFEISGFTVPQPKHVKHRGYVRGYRGKQGDTPGFFRDGPYVAPFGSGGGKATVTEMQHAMGIGWTDVRKELTEAVLPFYGEHIGRAFLSRLVRNDHTRPSTMEAAA